MVRYRTKARLLDCVGDDLNIEEEGHISLRKNSTIENAFVTIENIMNQKQRMIQTQK